MAPRAPAHGPLPPRGCEGRGLSRLRNHSLSPGQAVILPQMPVSPSVTPASAVPARGVGAGRGPPTTLGGILGGRNLGTARRGRHRPINRRGARLNVLRGSHDPPLIKYTESPRKDRAWASSSTPRGEAGSRPTCRALAPCGALLRPDPAWRASSSPGSASDQPPVTKRPSDGHFLPQI